MKPTNLAESSPSPPLALRLVFDTAALRYSRIGDAKWSAAVSKTSRSSLELPTRVKYSKRSRPRVRDVSRALAGGRSLAGSDL